MRSFLPLPLMLAFFCLAGCSASAPKDSIAPPHPSHSFQPPTLNVYIVGEKALLPMDIETYVAGVVAGEMPNGWPLEALKAQAILARTFVLKFVTEKDSRYRGADISTDIAEAQAYDAQEVNARVRQAVAETAGLILLTEDGALPYTWFHAHSGGMTETAVNGIDWQSEEPPYISVTEGLDSPDAPETSRVWAAVFTEEEFLSACRAAGASVETCREVRIGQKGKSGRAVTLLVDGVTVNAARLRISLGSAKMRSTLLTALSAEDGEISMAGQGYGHGVGMPQWGAYALAQQGKSGEEISLHYYNELRLVKAW